MARTRTLAASAVVCLGLMLSACSGQSGTPAAAPQVPATTSSSTSSAPATVTVTTRPPATTTSQSTSTSELRDSVITTPRSSSGSSSNEVPYNALISVTSINGETEVYVCDDLFKSGCDADEQHVWDLLAYYHPLGFNDFVQSSEVLFQFKDDVTPLNVVAVGLRACTDYVDNYGSAADIGRSTFVARFDLAKQESAGIVYDDAVYYVCGV